MARKRMLVVEQWCEHEIEFGKYIAKHPMEAMKLTSYDVETMLGEVKIAQAFKNFGMQVYDFDRDFSESILGESWSELLPEVVGYMPFPCLYMKLPFNQTSEGCVVGLDYIEDIVNYDEYDYGYAMEKPGVYAHPAGGLGCLVNTGERIVVVQGFAIPREFGLMFDDTPLGKYPDGLLLNGLAYLCSKNADIAAVYSPRKERRRNNAKRRSQATWHEVGYRIGAELRNYNRVKHERGEKTGRTVRPHMRRAHWHRYWVGSGDQRRLVLKWLAPTMVGVGIESATLHRVG